MSSSEGEATRVQATMEGRPTGRGSPGSSGTRVTVVYYLCRNGRHLEHPHLMELLLAAPRLYLRDVLSRLDAVRGKGMAAIYSWSCKRRYKTGFVWHDVSEDDVLLPAQGSEYVLKGSLLHHSPPPALAPPPPPPEHQHQHQQQQNVDTTIIPKVQCVKPTSPTPEQESPLSQEGCRTTTSSWPPSPPAPAPAPMVEAPPPLLQQQPQPQPQPVRSSFFSITGDGDEEAAHSSSSGSSLSPDNPTRGSGGSTPCSSGGASSPGSPPRLMPYNKHKPGHNSVAGHDAATQTDGIPPARRELQKDTSSMSGMAATPTKDGHRGGSSSSSSSTGGRSGTLETLIRAEALGRRGAATKRILLEEEEDKEAVQSLGAKLKPANLLMRLVACGWTMSARHHPACGLMHKPHHVHVDLPPSSPVLSPLGALIMRPPQTVGARVSESGGDCCGHCRGSFRQAAAAAGNGDESAKGMATSSSCKHDGVSEKEGTVRELVSLESSSKCTPQTIKMSSCEQSRSRTTLISITTDLSGEHDSSSGPSLKTLSTGTSKRMTHPTSGKIPSPRVVSFHDEKEKVVKIEERLASGARVIIQCAPLLKDSYISAKAM